MSSIDEFLRPTKLLCEVIGMWPKDVDSQTIFEKVFINVRRLFSFVAFGNIIVPQVLAIVNSRGNLAVVTRVGCVLITLALLVGKMIYLIFYGREFAQLYFAVRDVWGAGKSPSERKVYEGFARKGKIFTIVFFVSGLANNVTFTTAAIFDWVVPIYRGATPAEIKLQRHLPLEVWYGFDVHSSPNFEVAFGCQTISAIFCCIGIVSVDSVMLILALHICGQFALIRFWYRDIRRKMMADDKVNSPQILHREVQRCFRHHQKIICLADSFEALLNPLMFMQFITSGAEICLSGFAVTTGLDKMVDLAKFTNYLSAMMLQLAAWCLVGETLMQESEKVGIAVFHDVSWYDFPVYLQRDLLLVVLRSQKCCRLTAAKFQTMNVATLGDTLRTAASYFTLLRQMR